MQVTVRVGWRQVPVAVAVAAVGAVVWWASPAVSQTAGPEPAATFAFVARADNPVDALAAGAVAGQLGAPVYLTGSDSLDEQARQGLVDTAPQVVVLAGGSVALSPVVEQQIGELLPDAQVRRFAGAGRTETARLVNTLTGELGVDRPVLAGATVAGDVGVDGSLSVDGTDVGAALAGLAARVDGLEDERDLAGSRIDALEADVAAAQGDIGTLRSDLDAAQDRIGVLEATLAGVSRTGDTLLFAGMNVQVVNGDGDTETSNGLGNVIIGYNAQRPTAATRTGSHYLVVGDEHEWTAYGGIIAGLDNTASGDWASVSGGNGNTASGEAASVSGGFDNTASGEAASVSGGVNNTASGDYASVSGGGSNTASGNLASVAGGRGGTASGSDASVSGGFGNSASGFAASVAGGGSNTASGSRASVSGGFDNIASGFAASVAGGRGGTVADDYDSRIGDTDFPDA